MAKNVNNIDTVKKNTAVQWATAGRCSECLANSRTNSISEKKHKTREAAFIIRHVLGRELWSGIGKRVERIRVSQLKIAAYAKSAPVAIAS
jgi:hypothetical protein